MATHKPAVIISNVVQDLPSGDGLKDIASIENGLVINDAGADVDFRVESTGYAGMFFVDAGSNAVQIGDGALGNIADFRASGTVFNELGSGMDFRVESDGYAYALWVHGASNTVYLSGVAEFVYGGAINFYAPQVVINSAAGAADFRVAGDAFSHLLFADGTNLNIALVAASAPSWQGMERGLFIGDALAAPGSNPTSGAFLYSDGGTLFMRTSTGTVVNLGNAGGGSVDIATNHFRLGLVSGDPTADATGQSTLYCTPFVGNQIALYDGSDWVLRSGSQFSLSLSGLTTGALYDVFVYDNAGTLTLELGAAWTDTNTRSTAIVKQDGVYVKNGAVTRRYVGTIRAVSATQTTSNTTLRYVYNYYNRVPLTVNYGVANATSYSLTTPRVVGAIDSGRRIVIGVANETSLVYSVSVFGRVATVGNNAQIGGGYVVNSTNALVTPVAGWMIPTTSSNSIVAAVSPIVIAHVGVIQIQVFERVFSGTILTDSQGFEWVLLL